jgi:hemerythrin-like domain-containing protein
MPSERPLHSGCNDELTERIPDNILLEPVDYLFADHCRQVILCDELHHFIENFFNAPPNPDRAAAILSCLEVDVNLHVADEELDLFPRLRIRARAEDRFSELLRLLDKEHGRNRTLVEEVCADLTHLAQGQSLEDPDRFCRSASALAASHISHLEWENAVLLPLARLRLTSEDLSAMSKTMAARRSIPYPGN